MWSALTDHFRRYPAQDRVVRMMIRHGIRVSDGKMKIGDIEIADTAVARAANVDRRIVRSAVVSIEKDPILAGAFQRFESTLHLKEVAGLLGCGVIEITPDRPDRPGILAGVANAIAARGLSVRQAIVEDPEFVAEPRLYVVTEKRVPSNLIPSLMAVQGVKSVTIS